MKTIELFAGGGGLALGLHDAGFDPVAAVERDGDSCDTLRQNWHGRLKSDVQIFGSDVRQLDFSEWQDKVELVSGGPPCQPFSIGGKHRGYRDDRDMFPAAVAVVRQVRPKAFLFENVRGLLRKSFSKYFGYILLQMHYPDLVKRAGEDWTAHLVRLEKHHTGGKEFGLRYRVVFRKINAADYGVPQHRERVLIVGFRWDIKEPWSFPDPTHSGEALEISKWITGEYWEEHNIQRYVRPPCPKNFDKGKYGDPRLIAARRWLTVRDALKGLPDPQLPAAAVFLNHKYQAGARKYTGHTGSLWDEPAKALKAGDHGVPGGENMLVYPRGAVRYFTVRESARIQTFPDWYGFNGSWTESMRQIGNAVPVKLAGLVGGSISNVLKHHRPKDGGGT